MKDKIQCQQNCRRGVVVYMCMYTRDSPDSFWKRIQYKIAKRVFEKILFSSYLSLKYFLLGNVEFNVF